MTNEDFENLTYEQKKIEIFEAEKIDERLDDLLKYELFKIDNFYVEVCTSRHLKFKRNIYTYPMHDLPLLYAEGLVAKSA